MLAQDPFVPAAVVDCVPDGCSFSDKLRTFSPLANEIGGRRRADPHIANFWQVSGKCGVVDGAFTAARSTQSAAMGRCRAQSRIGASATLAPARIHLS
jgi:hypothetical protein